MKMPLDVETAARALMPDLTTVPDDELIIHGRTYRAMLEAVDAEMRARMLRNAKPAGEA